VLRAALFRRAARTVLAVLVALAAALAITLGGGAQASSAAPPPIPAHTFIDLVPSLPSEIGTTGTPDTATDVLVPSWSGELVRPAPSTPGPSAVLAGDDAVVPYLATSWSTESNGDVVFTLRRGVRGPTGDPFTATDVSWSLRRAIARDPEAPFFYRLAHVDLLDPVTILSTYRVRVNVTAPSPFLLSVLSGDDATIYDSRAYRSHATAGDPWAVAWGSSNAESFCAYYVADYIPRHEVVLAANPGFWRRPYFTTVDIKAQPDSGVRLGAVLGGTATHTSGLDWSDYATAASAGVADGASASILENGPQVLTWQLNVSSGPLANPLVRQAINLGLDRPLIAKTLSLAYDQPASSSIPAAYGHTQPNPFDPEQARTLMREAGFLPPGITVDIDTDPTVAGPEVSTLLTQIYLQMQEIGVTVHTIYVEDPDQLLALEAAHTFQSTIQTSTPLIGGAGMLLEQNDNSAFDPVSPAAIEGYTSGSVLSALSTLRSTPPGATAQSLISQAASAVDSDLPTIELATVPVQNVTRANVRGYSAYAQPIIFYENLRAVGS
jgi:peptide/nickel transport system substrate-binding protein